MSREEKLKALSNKVDFYVMELMSYEEIPTFGNSELRTEIVAHLQKRLFEAFKAYKEEVSTT